MNVNIPRDHPRYDSLMSREKIIEGFDADVVAAAGLIAHGRGEAFDYLLGEQSWDFGQEAAEAAACAFLTARHPVISVNGNVAALCPDKLVKLAQVSGAPLEVNLFYRSPVREQAIEKQLKAHGARGILGLGKEASATIPELGSERRRVDPEGILKADVVLVPLEDGDRTEALVRMGKTVITIDLNPLSRTALKANITIVDNVLRALDLLIERIAMGKGKKKQELTARLSAYDNKQVLGRCLRHIVKRLELLAVDKGGQND